VLGTGFAWFVWCSRVFWVGVAFWLLILVSGRVEICGLGGSKFVVWEDHFLGLRRWGWGGLFLGFWLHLGRLFRHCLGFAMRGCVLALIFRFLFRFCFCVVVVWGACELAFLCSCWCCGVG